MTQSIFIARDRFGVGCWYVMPDWYDLGQYFVGDADAMIQDRIMKRKLKEFGINNLAMNECRPVSVELTVKFLDNNK